MEITGTTDLIQFNGSDDRVNSRLDVKNLRDDKFVTVRTVIVKPFYMQLIVTTATFYAYFS